MHIVTSTKSSPVCSGVGLIYDFVKAANRGAEGIEGETPKASGV